MRQGQVIRRPRSSALAFCPHTVSVVRRTRLPNYSLYAPIITYLAESSLSADKSKGRFGMPRNMLAFTKHAGVEGG